VQIFAVSSLKCKQSVVLTLQISKHTIMIFSVAVFGIVNAVSSSINTEESAFTSSQTLQEGHTQDLSQSMF